MDLISVLPTGILSAIVENWLDLRDVTHLDSAFCNDKRQQILEILESMKCLSAPEQSFKWLNLRSIQIEDVLLTDKADINLFRLYARRFGDKFRLIQLDHAVSQKTDILMCVTLYCKKITAFVSENSNCDNAMSNLLFACTELQELRLGRFNVIPVIKKPKYIKTEAGCSTLTSISVSEFEFIEQIVAEKPHAVLSTVLLNLNSCNQLTSAGVPLLAKFTSLTSLSLYACKLNDTDIIQILQSTPHIIHLDVSISREVSDTSVRFACEHLTQLRTLNVELTSITDSALVAVSRYCAQQLIALYFADCAQVTAVGVTAVLKTCLKLRTMSMATYQAEAFDKPGNLSVLANLQTLTIEGRQPADDMLESIAQHCTHLKHLRIVCLVSDVYADRGLTALALHCAHLCTLVLVGDEAPRVQPLALTLWQKLRPKLNITYDRNVLTYHILDRTECI